MRVEFEIDDRFWVKVPSAFPSDGFDTAETWAESIVKRYVDDRSELMLAEKVVVRHLALGAHASLLPTALFGVQFWPTSAPIALMVHVEIGQPLRPSDDPVQELLHDVPLALAPSIEVGRIAEFDSVLSARFVLSNEGRADPLSGVGYLLTGPHATVRIMTSPTTTAMVGLIDGPLRDLVATTRLLDISPPTEDFNGSSN